MINENTVRDPLPYGKPSKSLDLIGFAKRYGLFILVIGSFLFTIAVPVVLLISKPNYEVKAVMRIEPVIPSLITTSEDPSIINYYQDYARTQAQRMLDFEILEKTVKKLSHDEKAALFPSSMPTETCATILGFIIKVNPVMGTHLIEITASNPKKKGLAPLINNFMAVFLEKVRKSTELQDQERLAYLRNKKQSLITEVTTLEGKLIILTKDIYTATFSEAYNLAGKKTEELQILHVKALGEQINAATHYDEKIKLNTQLKALSLDPMVEEMVMNNASLDLTSSWTYQQQQQMRSSTDGLTKTNPDRIYIEQRMNAMQGYEKTQRNELTKNAHKILYGKRDLELNKEVIVAKNDLEKAKTAEEQIKEQLDKNREDAIKISVGIHLGESLEAELKHKRELLDRIDTRIQELEIEGKAPLRFSIESAAREPNEPSGSNTKQLLIMFFALSFGGVGALFFAYDFFDNRIRRPKDILLALGYPPLANIPKSTGLTPFHQLLLLGGEQEATKAIRSMAVRLNREKEENNASVFLFTGVDHSVGCTSIALNTAQALAALKPKVLLIEGNIEAPALGKLTGSPAEPSGFSDFLASSAPWSEFVISNPEYNISIMHAGNRSSSAIQQQRIPELFAEARKEYDCICVDCAPVLQSDLTEHLALYADIIMLITLGESTLYRDLRSAAELLVRLHVPAIAPILNWGGIKRSMSIDKLLEKQPEILERINTKKIEEILQNLPPTRDLIKKVQAIIEKILTKKKKPLNEEKK